MKCLYRCIDRQKLQLNKETFKLRESSLTHLCLNYQRIIKAEHFLPFAFSTNVFQFDSLCYLKYSNPPKENCAFLSSISYQCSGIQIKTRILNGSFQSKQPYPIGNNTIFKFYHSTCKICMYIS